MYNGGGSLSIVDGVTVGGYFTTAGRKVDDDAPLSKDLGS
jgi:hypothetical protein